MKKIISIILVFFFIINLFARNNKTIILDSYDKNEIKKEFIKLSKEKNIYSAKIQYKRTYENKLQVTFIFKDSIK